jgi:hypothetical protein
MENVLDPVNDGGSREAEDVENALDTEEIRPSESEEDIQPQLERFGENGNIECQANSANVLIMSIDVVRMSMGVGFRLMMMRAVGVIEVTIVIVGSCCIGFGVQPALDIKALGLRVIEPGVEQPGGVDRTI